MWVFFPPAVETHAHEAAFDAFMAGVGKWLQSVQAEVSFLHSKQKRAYVGL